MFRISRSALALAGIGALVATPALAQEVSEHGVFVLNSLLFLIGGGVVNLVLILAFAREPFAALDLPEAVEVMLDEKVKAWLGVPGAFGELDL